jgi:GntR family transcriptional regulator/MocR family aminotransferase
VYKKVLARGTETSFKFANRKGCYIWESAFAAQFRYASAPLPALKSLDRNDNVIFSGDFWMTMGPLAKLGYVVLPQRLLPVFQRLLKLCGNNVAMVDQLALQQFIQDGQWERHILKTKTMYARKRQLLLQNLANILAIHFQLRTNLRRHT